LVNDPSLGSSGKASLGVCRVGRGLGEDLKLSYRKSM